MDLANIKRIKPRKKITCDPPDISEAVSNALAQTLGRRSVTAIINDPQRDTDSRAVLAEIVRQISPEPIRILIACGSHSFPDPLKKQFEAELGGLIDPDQIAWHDCRSDTLTSIGGIWRGHPWLVETPRLIAIGSIEPHYFGGFTGPHKTATIGCAAFADIQANHTGAMSSESRPCKLDGNPVYQGVCQMLEALEGLRPIGAVNMLQVRGRHIAIAGGKILDTLSGLTSLTRQAFVARISKAADALVLDVKGALATSFYQADKGIKNSEWAVKAGGAIILKAPCPDGIGQDHFVELLKKASTHSQALALVNERGYRLGDHKAVRLRYLTDPACRNVRLYLVSDGIDEAQAATLGMTKSASVDQAIIAAGLDVQDQKIYCIEDAGNVCVEITPPSKV